MDIEVHRFKDIPDNCIKVWGPLASPESMTADPADPPPPCYRLMYSKIAPYSLMLDEVPGETGFDQSDKFSYTCGPNMEMLKTVMESTGYKCLQFGMWSDFHRPHAYFKSGHHTGIPRLDFALGFFAILPEADLLNATDLNWPWDVLYPSTLIGAETFTHLSSLDFFELLDPPSWFAILVVMLTFAVIEAFAARVTSRDRLSPLLSGFTFIYSSIDYFGMFLMQIAGIPAHLQHSVVELSRALWIASAFILTNAALNELLDILMAPPSSTRYWDSMDLLQRRPPELKVDYFEGTNIDRWLATGRYPSPLPNSQLWDSEEEIVKYTPIMLQRIHDATMVYCSVLAPMPFIRQALMSWFGTKHVYLSVDREDQRHIGFPVSKELPLNVRSKFSFVIRQWVQSGIMPKIMERMGYFTEKLYKHSRVVDLEQEQFERHEPAIAAMPLRIFASMAWLLLWGACLATVGLLLEFAFKYWTDHSVRGRWWVSKNDKVFKQRVRYKFSTQ